MKRLIYITYLSLLALFLISCDKEIVAPDTATENSSFASNRTGGSCTNYSYQTKTGPVQLGTANPYEILVEIDNSLSLAQKAAILSKYRPFRAITGEFYTESGLVTIVELKSNTTCLAAEQMMAALELESAVRFALPTFTNGGAWDEFIIVLSNSGSERNLLQLVANTKTRIVGDPSLFGPKTYVISADKGSTGNVYEMISFFNTSSRILYAEPVGFIYPVSHTIKKRLDEIQMTLTRN